MTHFRSTLVAALLTFGAAAVASAQATNPAPQNTARAQHQKGPGRHHGDRAMLKGISLTDGEKANLKNVQAKYATQMKALREQSKPQSQAMRDARQRGDTAAVRAMREKNAPQRQQAKQLLDAQRAEFRSALSPENQAKFDANLQQAKARMAKHGGFKKGAQPGVATSR
jgi:Spy/CpxP family protein refolding chaperone